MKLYKNSNGVWAGTQAKARSFCGKDYTAVDVPVDKAGLLQFLNLHQVGSYTSNGKEDIEDKPNTYDTVSYTHLTLPTTSRV